MFIHTNFCVQIAIYTSRNASIVGRALALCTTLWVYTLGKEARKGSFGGSVYDYGYGALYDTQYV